MAHSFDLPSSLLDIFRLEEDEVSIVRSFVPKSPSVLVRMSTRCLRSCFALSTYSRATPSCRLLICGTPLTTWITPGARLLQTLVATPGQLKEIMSCCSGPAPTLRKFSISSTTRCTELGLSIPAGLFGGPFASLRTFRLVGFLFLNSPQWQHFPQPTRLQLKSWVNALLEALEQIPSFASSSAVQVVVPHHHTPPRLVMLSKLRGACPLKFIPSQP